MTPAERLRRLPLARGLRAPSRSFRMAVGVVFGMALLCLGVAALGPMQRAAMKHQHVTGRSALSWSLFHAKPAMYNFGNEYFLSPRPLTERNVDRPKSRARRLGDHRWLNHYPLQVPLWWYRPEVSKEGGRLYVLLRSRFQDEEVVTRLVIQATADRELRILEAP